MSWNISEKPIMVNTIKKRGFSCVYKSSHPLSSCYMNETQISKIFSKIIMDSSKDLPKDEITRTKMYVFATAGLRILPEYQQNDIISRVYSYLYTNSPYKVKKKYIRIMSGDEEGLYGWISVNYLMNSLSYDNITYGSIDMGGASTQVAYQIENKQSSEHIINYNSKDFYVKSESLLGFGVNEAMKKTFALLNNFHPCFPKGFSMNLSNGIIINGSGSFWKCTEIIQKIIPKKEFIILKNEFISMASFYYLNSFFNLTEGSSIEELSNHTIHFCELEWELMNRMFISNEYLKNYCFFGAYQYLFLQGSFGYSFSKTSVKKVGHINGSELSWAIGAMMVIIGSVKIDKLHVPLLPMLVANFALVIEITFIMLPISNKRKSYSYHQSTLLKRIF